MPIKPFKKGAQSPKVSQQASVVSQPHSASVTNNSSLTLPDVFGVLKTELEKLTPEEYMKLLTDITKPYEDARLIVSAYQVLKYVEDHYKDKKLPSTKKIRGMLYDTLLTNIGNGYNIIEELGIDPGEDEDEDF